MQTNTEAPKARKLIINDVVEGAAPPAKQPAAAAAPPKFEPTQLVKLELIEPDPHNPRKDFPKEEMLQLTHSVSLRGVLQAVTLRPIPGGRYRLVSGERRFRAAKGAGLDAIKAEVRQLTDLEAADIQLEENLGRADLAPLEVAGGYRRQLDLGRTMDQICERAGKKRSAVYAMMNLLNLDDESRKALGEERITASVAQEVASYAKSVQPRALSIVIGQKWSGPLSYREAKVALERELLVDLRKAPFEIKAEGIPCVAKSCFVCPNCVRNKPEMADVKNQDACVSPDDYRTKVFAEARSGIEAKGWKMMKPADAAKLFYNHGAGAVDSNSGYIETTERCFDDTQNRPYKELLTTEQLKALVLVAIDGAAKPRQVLERAGIMRELKKGGIFKPRKKSTAAAPRSSSSPAAKADSPTHYRDPPPGIEELVDRAVVAKMVEGAEKKGLPAVAKMVAFELACASYQLAERRGIKDRHYLTGKDCEKYFGKYAPQKLAGLLFEAGFDQRLENAEDMTDVQKALDVDPKKVRLEVEKANPVRWSEDARGATGQGKKGDYLIEKKGKMFFFAKPKAANPVLYATLELAKAAAVDVDAGRAPGFAFTATGMKSYSSTKKPAPKTAKAKKVAKKKGGGK